MSDIRKRLIETIDDALAESEVPYGMSEFYDEDGVFRPNAPHLIEYLDEIMESSIRAGAPVSDAVFNAGADIAQDARGLEECAIALTQLGYQLEAAEKAAGEASGSENAAGPQEHR